MKYPCHIDTKRWKFVKDGLDDFRDGLPPPHDDIMLEVIFSIHDLSFYILFLTVR